MHIKKSFLISLCQLILLPTLFAQSTTENPPLVSGKDYVPGRLIVKMKPDEGPTIKKSKTQSTFNDTMQQMGIVSKKLFRGTSKEADMRRAAAEESDIKDLLYMFYFDSTMNVEEVIKMLENTGKIEYAEPDYIYHTNLVPNDSNLGQQFYLENVNAFTAWDITLGSEEIVVGVVDSGIDIDHPDLVNKLYVNEDEIPNNNIDDDNDGYIDNYLGWDFVGADTLNFAEDSNPEVISGGTNSHGTWVSGCIAAEANNEIGIAGVGYNTRVLNTKHSFDNQRTNDGRVFNSIQGVIYLIEMGVDIINLSIGGAIFSQGFQDIINDAVLQDDIVIIASAGNSNSDMPRYPAAYDNVISVSALQSDNTRSGFSSFGNTVDIAAPGSGIFTTAFDGSYESVNGTSFSAPIVSGAAALLRAHFPNFSAIQIAEQLRVTADESIYDIEENVRFELGEGILDVTAALSNVSPSIRYREIQFTSSSGEKSYFSGDTITVSGEFINFLIASSANLQIELTTESPWVEIISGTFSPGILEEGDSVSNNETPYIFRILDDAPNEEDIVLRLSILDGNYEDQQDILITLNPSFINISPNRIATTVTSVGRIGFREIEDGPGQGFIFNNENLLFEMGLVMGNSANRISSAVRGEVSNFDLTTREDFQVEIPLQKVEKMDSSLLEIRTRINNALAGYDDQQLSISQRVIGSDSSDNNQFIVVEYKITNNSNAPIENFYTGLYADWDISSDDNSGWNEAHRLGYIFSNDRVDTTLAGIQVFNLLANHYPINNDEDVPNSPFGVLDGFTDEEKFQALSAGTSRTSAELFRFQTNDLSHLLSAGPYLIPEGDSIHVAFAIHAANSLEEILSSAKNAKEFFEEEIGILTPEVVDINAICAGESATIRLVGEGDFFWYANASTSQPFFQGIEYMTTPLVNDTVLFVTRVEGDLESNRLPISISPRANPTLTIDGETSFCVGDSVLISVNEASTYTWNTGETSQQITVKTPGSYSVTVTDTESGCSNTSEIVTVDTFPSPIPNFDLTPIEILSADQELYQFEDLSQGAVEWAWDFGNGVESDLQNPEVPFTRGEGEVTLTVASTDGCQATISKTFIVTDVEDGAKQESRFELFPNPIRDRAQLTLSGQSQGHFKVSVFNVFGKEIYSLEKEKKASSLSLSIDFTSLPSGIYLIKIQQYNKDVILRNIVKL